MSRVSVKINIQFRSLRFEVDTTLHLFPIALLKFIGSVTHALMLHVTHVKRPSTVFVVMVVRFGIIKYILVF